MAVESGRAKPRPAIECGLYVHRLFETPGRSRLLFNRREPGHAPVPVEVDGIGPYLRSADLPTSATERFLPFVTEARRSAFLDRLEEDAYVSLHGMLPRRNGNGIAKGSSAEYLTCCWVDLDHGHTNGEEPALSHAQASAEVARLVEAKRLPPVSLLLDSGRGTWLFWLLRADPGADGEDRLGVKARKRNQEVVRSINRAIVEVIDSDVPALRPDYAAGQRMSVGPRVNGSRNSAAGRLAQYIAPIDPPPRYTLGELEIFFELAQKPARRRSSGRSRSEGQDPQAIRSAKARYQRPLEELQRLGRFRGGFREGHRHLAILYFTLLLEGLRRCAPAELSESDAEERSYRFAAECCEQGLGFDGSGHAEGALRSAEAADSALLQVKNETIRWSLSVTREEADRLSLKSLHPDWAPKAAASEPGVRDRRRAQRWALLRDLADEHGVVERDGWTRLPFTEREIRLRLKAAGCDCARQTVRGDLAALQVRSRAAGVAAASLSAAQGTAA
jgi:hypothetical protein